MVIKQFDDSATSLLIRSESYDLVEATKDRSMTVVMAWAATLPLVLRIFIGSNLAPPFILAWWFLLISLHLIASILMRGRRLKRSHLKATQRGISLFDKEHCLWTVVWPDIDRVTLRAYRMPLRFFGEAYVFTLKDGQQRIVPSRSHLYGPMPNWTAFEDRLRSQGIYIEYDRNVRWLGFLSF